MFDWPLIFCSGLFLGFQSYGGFSWSIAVKAILIGLSGNDEVRLGYSYVTLCDINNDNKVEVLYNNYNTGKIEARDYLGNPNYIMDRERDPSGKGFKTTIKARPDNGIISQKTKVAIQRRASKPVTMLGYTPTGVVALIVPETKVSKDPKFDIGTDHPRTPVHYKIFDPTCADLPVWKICWDYTQRR
ncbi:MAG: hypothetical protein WDA59_03970 [Methanofastidiosum sp.]